jgi:hypothetical protein
MSISMERFGAEGQFTTYDAYRQETPPLKIYQLQCRRCAYESTDSVVGPRVCPKCGGEAWERLAASGIMLRNADRHPAC